MAISITIPEDILDSARMSAPELKRELAVSLYAQGRLSIGKARELADMSLWEFRRLLAARQVAVHLDPDDVQDDLTSLSNLSRQ